jgi:hypothetical protein
MGTKELLTSQFLKELGLPSEPKDIENIIWAWWRNPREDEKSFGLTTLGFNTLSKSIGLKFYQIDIPDSTIITNQITIWMDKYIDCPFYLDKKSIYVSREKVAVQLILFSGDLYKFGKSKEISRKNAETA